MAGVFPWLAKWQRTIFVRRDKRSKKPAFAVAPWQSGFENRDALVLVSRRHRSEGWGVSALQKRIDGAVVATHPHGRIMM